jgi:hypothetical protein
MKNAAASSPASCWLVPFEVDDVRKSVDGWYDERRSGLGGEFVTEVSAPDLR